MGWFDDDDDNDEGINVHTIPSQQCDSSRLACKLTKEDYIDPLDAFMDALASTGSSQTIVHQDHVDDERRDNDQNKVQFASTSSGGHRFDLDFDNDGEDDDFSEENNEPKILGWPIEPDTARKQYALIEKSPHNTASIVTTDVNGIIFHKATRADDFQGDDSVTRILNRYEWTASDTSRGGSWRSEHGVSLSRDNQLFSIDPLFSWKELSEHRNADSTLMQRLLQHLIDVMHQPTPVQQQTIPIILLGKNVVVTAATGQGKTIAYLIPTLIMNQIEKTSKRSMAVVLVPTRELALQVEHAARPILKALNQRCKAVIGGKVSNYDVIKDFKRNHYDLIVASPGRLIDVTKKVELDPIIVVLDECDKLLQLGFEDQVRNLLSNRFADSFDRQIVLMSATLNKRVETVAQEWLGPHSIRIAVGRTGRSTQFVTQHVMVLNNNDARTAFCVQLVPSLVQVGRVILFVATRMACESLAFTLENQARVKVATLHGAKHQWDRSRALNDFTALHVPVLVATDLAARGLDIPQVATVVCVHPSKNLDAHTHRIGRTGRLSTTHDQQHGVSYTLLTPQDVKFARILKSAFEREGRPIGSELQLLASSSSVKQDQYNFDRLSKSAEFELTNSKRDREGAKEHNERSSQSYVGPTSVSTVHTYTNPAKKKRQHAPFEFNSSSTS